jgi:hypothetical protein
MKISLIIFSVILVQLSLSFSIQRINYYINDLTRNKGIFKYFFKMQRKLFMRTHSFWFRLIEF